MGIFKKIFLVFAIMMLPGATAWCAAPILDAPFLVSAGGNTRYMDYYASVEVVDWNNDGKKDMLVGGCLAHHGTGRIKLFLNIGTDANPAFDSYTFLESNGSYINGYNGG